MVTPAELIALKGYMGAAAALHSDETLSVVLDVERAAQAHECRVPVAPEPYPADLLEALHRRVRRNLEMREIPLGAKPEISEMGIGTFRPGNDPEIARLERPYRKIGALG